ncbi:FUSC family protein [Nocardia stercoris]|uniref:FUSC family protein n=1 Tax=Nocardia stercoris TaxID=2483361 RepID=UPI0011C3B576|nr:FUSC family protein [Nocardia stercoris]
MSSDRINGEPSFPSAAHTLPARLRRRQVLWRLAGPPRYAAATRAGLALGIPAMLAYALGFRHEALIVALGTFAAFYGEGRPYRMRGRLIATVGLVLIGVVALGAVTARVLPVGSPSGRILEITVLAAVAGVSTYVADAVGLPPPGSYFIVLGCGAALVMSSGGMPVRSIVPATAAGVLSSVIVGLVPALIDRRKPERSAVGAAARAVAAYQAAGAGRPHPVTERRAAAEAIWAAWAAVHDAGLSAKSALVVQLMVAHRDFTHTTDRTGAGPDQRVMADPGHLPMARPTLRQRLRWSWAPASHATVTAVRVTVAAVAAATIATLLGLGRPDWALLAATLVLNMGPDRPRGVVRALQRFGGTALGLVLLGGLEWLSPSGVALILVLVTLQFLVELFVAGNYGLAVVFITPLALLLGGPGAHSSVPRLLGERMAETTIGVVTAVVVLWVVLPHAHRATLALIQRRVADTTAELLAALRADPASNDTWALRRLLRFELAGLARSSVTAAHDDRDWARANGDTAAALEHVGFGVLAECWSIPDGGQLPNPQRWERALRAAVE